MNARPWTGPGYQAVAALVSERTGLVFGPTRRAQVEAGIRRAAERAEATDLKKYRNRIEADQQALDDLVLELTIGETYFFRHTEQFELVRKRVLPEIRERRGANHVVRTWSAGCSTGEEGYALAIMLEQEGFAQRSYVLATDISRASLKTARLGRYRQWSLRGDNAEVVERYMKRIPDLHFGRRGDQFVVSPRFRKRVNFEYLNLALNVYPSLETGTWGMDVIFCRNVLIYFDTETIRRVAERLGRCLAKGGWLIMGPADPMIGDYAGLEAVATPAGIHYRNGAAPEPAFAVPELPWERSTTLETAEPLAWIEPEAPAFVEEPFVPGGVPAATAADSQVSDDAVAVEEVLAQAEVALLRGEYEAVVTLMADVTDDAVASALSVRALANIEATAAELVCAEATARFPLSAELRHLHAVLLLGLGRSEEARRAARCVVYLDGSLAAGHLTLAIILRQTGDVEGAKRAYRTTRDLLAARPENEPVPLCNGELAGRLAKVAVIELAMLDNGA